MEERVKVFKSVVDFRSSRPWPAALGFYVFHVLAGLLLGLIVGMVTVALSGPVDTDQARHMAARTGMVIAVVYSTVLYGAIIHSRKAWKNPWCLIGLLVSLVASMFGGALCGLIPSAVTLGINPNPKDAA